MQANIVLGILITTMGTVPSHLPLIGHLLRAGAYLDVHNSTGVVSPGGSLARVKGNPTQVTVAIVLIEIWEATLLDPSCDRGQCRNSEQDREMPRGSQHDLQNGALYTDLARARPRATACPRVDPRPRPWR